MPDSFGARSTFTVGTRSYGIFRLDALENKGVNLAKLPYSLKILLENLLRNEDDLAVTAEDILAVGTWDPKATPVSEIAYTPARVLMQDFTGVPAVVDLAAMRDAMATMGGDPNRINPLAPAELVIDHSVQVDVFGSHDAVELNTRLEYERNMERYAFLRWGQTAFNNFAVVPPETGICHQVNLEFLARVVFPGGDYTSNGSGEPVAYPDTLVGTDSHTTMINGLGVLGWGVGGIEAEAALLGQPVSMLIPRVVGFKLTGSLPEGSTATDLVLTVTEMLRKHGVVGKFVEFYGPGLSDLPLADRATIANMAPEYGATCGIFPVDAETLRYLECSGRSPEHVALVEAYMKEQGLFHDVTTPEAEYSERLELDLSTIVPSIAGPKRPQDRIELANGKQAFHDHMALILDPNVGASPAKQVGRWEGEGGQIEGGNRLEDFSQAESAVRFTMKSKEQTLHHGSVVIAAITSCTNTSNPSVMLAAGLLAKKAAMRGLTSKPWVKTSLAPGSRVVTEYYKRSGLMPYLEQVGFHVVGYGCTTCIGNSGPLPTEISNAIAQGDLVVCSVLSGNRNFEGRINNEIKANYLMSPPLVVAYALAGRMDIDLQNDPIDRDADGNLVYLRDLWPTQAEIADAIHEGMQSDMFRATYGQVYEGTEHWNALTVPEGSVFAWDDASTYVKRPPYFDDMPVNAPQTVADIHDARVLAVLGHSITTDHISPAGSIRANSPAGQYLLEHGVDPKDFNSLGARRGNHEVMMRGTFANVRLRNQLVPGVEGGFTKYIPTGEMMTIFDASMKYQADGTPLVILAGKEYGSGSSRDWAAKGPRLLGVRAVIAESYERIHRSNLIGMGILPLEFQREENAQTLGLTGEERFEILGVSEIFAAGFPEARLVNVEAHRADGVCLRFTAKMRIDTPQEMLYYRHGGILQYVLRQLMQGKAKAEAISGGMATVADPSVGGIPT
ncbi:MAG TPA: aconitate hydratase AcnA [Candidatus Kapabacteria bacterium]|nr:aconitate hydratase AcnA [Candidatus Kapabacteria bacterium]